MEPPNAAPANKPKSRLLAMKNRLRQKQKQQASGENSSGDKLVRTPGKPPPSKDMAVRSNGVRKYTTSPVKLTQDPSITRSKMQRSRTTETCLTENLSQNVTGIRPIKRSQTMDTKIDGMPKFRDPNRGSATLGHNGKENFYGQMPRSVIHSGRGQLTYDLRRGSDSETIYGTRQRTARDRAQQNQMLFQRSASLEDNSRPPSLTTAHRSGITMGSRVTSTKHGSIGNIPGAWDGPTNSMEYRGQQRFSPRDDGIYKTMTLPSSCSYIRTQNGPSRALQGHFSPPRSKTGHGQVSPPQYVLFRSHGLPPRGGLGDRHLSKSMDDLTEGKATAHADVSKLSAESDPSSNSTMQVDDKDAYLREWAVSKPRAVLLSRSASKPQRPMKQAPSQESLTIKESMKPAASAKPQETKGKAKAKEFFWAKKKKVPTATLR